MPKYPNYNTMFTYSTFFKRLGVNLECIHHLFGTTRYFIKERMKFESGTPYLVEFFPQFLSHFVIYGNLSL